MKHINGPAIKLHQLSKSYPAIQALKSLDISFPRGEIIGLIGHNGAGKSTLFQLMMNVITPTTGQVEVLGINNQSRQFKSVKSRIGYLPESIQFYDNLSGRETLSFFARLKGCANHDIKRLLDLTGLSEHAQRPVKEYSKGMKQRLGFAQALLGEPEILFLDEPTNGLDPDAIRHFYQVLSEMKSKGTSIILSSHILSEIEQRVDRLAVLKSGELIAYDTVEGLTQSLNLPLNFSVTLKQEKIPEELSALLTPFITRSELKGREWIVELHKSQKLAVIDILLRHTNLLVDFYWREPKLEDIYHCLRGDRQANAQGSQYAA